MTILSDTLHYRQDGTVSGVTRLTREAYTTPSGREVVDDVSTTVDLRDVAALLDGGYAAFDAHNKGLETQITTEREMAAIEKERALRAAADSYSEQLARKDQEHAAAIAEKEATHALEIARKDDALAVRQDALAQAIAARDAALAAPGEVEAVKQ